MIRNSKNIKEVWKGPKQFLSVVSVSFFIIIIQLIYVSLFPNLYGINMKEFAKSRNS